MGKFEDLTNKRFGKLLVVENTNKKRNKKTIWLCKCDCGNYKEVQVDNLTSGHTKSCGCLNGKGYKHNLKNTRLYYIWSCMKQRCYNENHKQYKDYGQRGIKICNEWHEFINFYNWAINNDYQDNLTIDRINNNGNYEPDNCRWVNMKIQSNNRRSNHIIEYKNETHTLKEWCDILKLNYKTIQTRINSLKWNVKKAFETPTNIKYRNKRSINNE